MLDPELLRGPLSDLCERSGFHEAAEVLRGGYTGVMTLPRALARTRDGREEIISMVQEAFESPRPPVMLITRGAETSR